MSQVVSDTNFTRPTLSEIIARIEADFNTRIPGADSRLRRSTLNVMATAEGGLAHSMFGYLDFIARQIMIDTAVKSYLERHGTIYSINRKTSTKSTGNVTCTGTDGITINAGERLRTADEIEFEVTTATTIASGTASVPVEAVDPALAGNIAQSTVLTFVSPISGVNSTGQAAAAFTGGTDNESDELLRDRILTRLRQPPHGGSWFDYETWAKEVAGVTRAWVYPQELADNGVTIRFMMDDTYTDGIPLSADVATVQAYINERRPVTAVPTVVAPVPVTQNFTVGLKKADGTTETSTTVQNAVTAQLTDLIRRDAEPGGTLRRSRIIEAISLAAGEHNHALTSPAADVVFTTGQIAKMGMVTY